MANLSLLKRAGLLNNPTAHQRAMAGLLIVAEEFVEAPPPRNPTAMSLNTHAARVALGMRIFENPEHWMRIMVRSFTVRVSNLSRPERLALEDDHEGMTAEDVNEVDEAVLSAWRAIWDNYLTMTVPK
jgi:hypothetical protein